MKRKRIIFSLLFCITFLSVLPKVPIRAEEKPPKQIVFLLDASKSMETTGEWSRAIDTVRLMTSVLPREYEAGLVVYNAEILYEAKPEQNFSVEKADLGEIRLQGYTNPGLALERAIELFAEKGAEKRVIFISDGEISMKDESGTEEAVACFEEAVTVAAEKQIRIDMFLLQNDRAENGLSEGITATGGNLLEIMPGQNPESVAFDYLLQELQPEWIEAGSANAEAGAFSVDLQDDCVGQAKVILLSEQELDSVRFSGQCKQMTAAEGERFWVWTLTEPMEQKLQIDYTLSEKGLVHAYLIKEYDLQVQPVGVQMTEQGCFELSVGILGAGGRSFLETQCAPDTVQIRVDGKRVSYRLNEAGEAVIVYNTDTSRKVTVDIVFVESGSIIRCADTAQEITLEVPEPEPVEEKTDYTVLIAVLGSLCVVFLLLLFWYESAKLKKVKKKSVIEVTEEDEDGNGRIGHDFSGQISVYLLKGGEAAPCSIRLFGRKRRYISFDWVKEVCGIRESLKDADKIRFFGGKNHALCLKNTGCATIVQGREILLQDKKYELNYGEKILLIFNDGAVEIELHYKNSKPNERER